MILIFKLNFYKDKDMLDICNSSKQLPSNLLPFESIINEPVSFNPHELWNFERKLHRHAASIADSIMFNKLIELHEDKDEIKKIVNIAKQNSLVPLINKGLRPVTILLLGGTKIIIDTTYLRTDWKKLTGHKHTKRGKKGSGLYPVLEALGVAGRVTPATREEIALYTVQASSYQEASEILARKGISIGSSALQRIACAAAEDDISLRDAALSSAMNIPVPSDGPLAGKRVFISVDGGRIRTRVNKKGRRTKKGTHRFCTPWREPRIIVISLLNDDGSSDSFSLPLYDTLIDDADAAFNLIIGYLRLLGAAYAEIIAFVSDGAEWIWDRVHLLVSLAEIDSSKLVKVLDFYHGSEHLYEAVELLTDFSKKERKKLYKRLRHILRHDPDGITKVINKLNHLGKTQKIEEMNNAIKYFEKHIDHMQYAIVKEMCLPIGSGQVESVVRRVINLRFKAPGTFWKEGIVKGLMHLRAFFKAGRWDEMMKRILTGKFIIPTFELEAGH